MIIGCPNCETKYNLPDDKIPPEGRKVKCSKCGHMFRAAPPPSTPEEEVEVLLDETASAEPPEDSSADFDAAFEEAVASQDEDMGDEMGEEMGGEPGEPEGFPDEDEDESLGAVFDEVDQEMAPEEEMDEDEKALEAELAEETGEEDLDFEPAAEEEESLFPMDEDEGLSLDGGKKSKKGKKGKKKGRPLLVIFLLLLLLLAAALVTFNMGLWNEKDFINDPPVVELPFELPVKVPFLHGPQAQEPTGPGESPTESIKYIQPVDFRQYIITNEKAGPVFVVEGKALNKFTTPKERIKVRVTLFDAQGQVLASQEQLCGNTLSLFQLQVQSEAEIVDALNSQAGIYANNSYIKPGETTPFMLVFFDPPEAVEEYQIKIVDARDPAQ